MKFTVEPDQSSATGEWKRPGVFLVAEGVYRVALPLPFDGLQAVNVYLLTHDDRVTIIDSGWSIPESRELLLRALSSLDMSALDIERFLITHLHRDHYEQSIDMRLEFGTRVALGHAEEPTLDFVHSDQFKLPDIHLARLRAWGAADLADQVTRTPAPSAERRKAWEYPDEWISPGPTTVGPSRVLNAVHTPGHTIGHMVFHDDAAGLLFAGDHILPTITPSIGLEPIPNVNPLGNFMDSLRLVRTMPDARLLPAHGPVTHSSHTRIDELLAHHVRRLDQCIDALDDGCSTPYDVARHLKWTRHDRAFSELDLMNATLATAESGAHLELLVIQGRVRTEEIDGLRHFFAA
ncbi:MAG: MBL fold metallo-hydrolase [bacterium]|nr:MBL fold metallo-hydrolase [bacterium]